MRDTKLSRRRLLTLGGATLAAGTLGGAAYAASPGRLLQSVTPAQAPARNTVHLAGTDGWVAIPAPATPVSYDFPDNIAPEGKTTYVFGFRDVTGLHRPAGAGPEGQDADLRAAALVRRVPGCARQRRPGDRHEPRHAGSPGPHRRAHPALARVPQRDPVLRRRARDERLDPDRARPDLLLPAQGPGHVHVPLPLRGRGARADGHDGPAVRAAAPERHRARRVQQVRLQRRRRLDRLRPRVRAPADRDVPRVALAGRPHPAAAVGSVPRRRVVHQRPQLPRHARRRRRASTARPSRARRASPSATRSRGRTRGSIRCPASATSPCPRWSSATPAIGCCCAWPISATSSTP